MRNWALLLHFYQPSTQDTKLTKHILNICYLPVLDMLLNHPEQQFSINITSTLILQLEKLHAHTFFDKIQTLVKRDQIELVNSPTYHPLAPLTPWDVVLRQLQYDQYITHDVMGCTLSNALFLPELAIDQATLTHIADETDYDWCLVDESTVDPHFELQTITGYRLMQYKSLKLPVSSRALAEILRGYPQWINQHKLVDFIYAQTPDTDTIISANDVELFGHHYEERIHILRELLEMHDRVSFIKISQAVATTDSVHIALENFIPSTWQTSTDELEQQTPFARWLDLDNELQQKYQLLSTIAYDALSSIQKPEDDIGLVYTSAERHFDQGTASCYPYWLSNNPWWHPELVEIGAQELIKAVRSLDVDIKIKRKAEKVYVEFIKLLWEKHWSDEIEEQYMLYSKNYHEMIKTIPDMS